MLTLKAKQILCDDQPEIMSVPNVFYFQYRIVRYIWANECGY